MQNDLQSIQDRANKIEADLKNLTTDFENHRHADPRGYPINLVNINGFIPTIYDTISSTTNLARKLVTRPTNLYDQAFYWTDTSLKRLYWYDSMNTSSTYSSAWHYFSAGQSAQPIGIWSSTTPTLNLSTASIFNSVLTGNTTFSVSNASIGQTFVINVQQGSGTTYTNTWFSGITWITSGGTAPTQTTVSGGITSYIFICVAANTYYGYLAGTQ